MFFNDWLERRKVYTPERVAVTDAFTGRSVTYAELNRRACALAAWMREEVRLQRGDRVASLSLNRLEVLDLFFACGKLGVILVPLNYRQPEHVLGKLVADCTPRLLVCEEEWLDLARSLQLGGVVPHVASMDSGVDGIAAVCMRSGATEGGFAAYGAELEEVAMILYTSGTTGLAKGAMISWRQIHWNAVNTTIGLQLTQDDAAFLNTPLYHTGGWHVLFTPLMHLGGRVVLQKQFDPVQCNERIVQEKLTILFGIPTTLKMMMEAPNFASADFSSLRVAICGGEPCPLSVLKAYHEKGVPIRQGYGLTEAGPNCFSLPAEDAMCKAGSVGFPNFHVGTRIEKADGSEAGPGEAGELLMRGPHLFSGYWNNPEATCETLSDGWVRTGDLFQRDAEGYHYVVGRKKEMFISGGENVYPARVEKVLLQHPAIVHAAVVGVPDAQWGETGCAFVVFRRGHETGIDALWAWCRPLLARYECPKFFRPLDELPMGHSGKVDRAALRTCWKREGGAGFVVTDRLRVHCRGLDGNGANVVLFFHGNASSSTCWEEVIADLPPTFRGIAPDLRGYGLTSRDAVIDATRGTSDWVDDAFGLLAALNVDRFHLVGHSLGGMVCWGLLADPRFAGRIVSATLVAPGPPCGFGGVHGPAGEPNNPDFSGSGAGLAHPRFVELIAKGERGLLDPVFSPRAVMNRMFWKPPFHPAREEALLDAMLQIHLGPRQFPGDSALSDYWPGFAPGWYGPINAISAKYNRFLAQRVLDSPSKPPLLCVLGDDDPVISDASQPDPGFQGKAGYRPGWPGDKAYPPQPLRTQLLSVLDAYARRGGRVERCFIADCGHSPFIEKPGEFRMAFQRFALSLAGTGT